MTPHSLLSKDLFLFLAGNALLFLLKWLKNFVVENGKWTWSGEQVFQIALSLPCCADNHWFYWYGHGTSVWYWVRKICHIPKVISLSM